jgi:hypothetical protein
VTMVVRSILVPMFMGSEHRHVRVPICLTCWLADKQRKPEKFVRRRCRGCGRSMRVLRRDSGRVIVAVSLGDSHSAPTAGRRAGGTLSHPANEKASGEAL